jgi:hypothetical protein
MSTTRTSTPQLAARGAAAVCVLTAAFHAALVVGAPWGVATQGGRMSGTLDAQGRIIAGVSVGILLVMAASILARTGEGPLHGAPPRVVTVLAWLTTIYATMAVVLNLITTSATERAIWAPVSIVLIALIAYVMVTTRPRSAHSDRASSLSDPPPPSESVQRHSA